MYRLMIFVLLSSVFLCVNTDVVCTTHEVLITCIPESGDNANTLQRGSVSDNEEVEEIYMNGCKLSAIELESFENIPNLSKLDLSNNLLNITDGILSVLINLKSLNMSRNSMTVLSAEFLQSLGELSSLDLSNNRIKEIHTNAFDHTPKLQYLYLANNLLDGIQTESLDKLTQVILLDLSKNVMSGLSIDVFDAIKKVNILDLSSSKFSPIPIGIFDQLTDLTSLYLSSNNISDVTSEHFAFNAKLRMLDLSNNNIASVGADVFAPLTSLKILNMSKNQLTDASFILPLKQLSSLDVANNRLAGLPATNSTSLRILDISNNRFTNLGMNVGILLPRKLTMMNIHKNPWQCTCLEQIVTVLQRRKVAYKDNYYFNGKRPVCVIPDKPARCSKDTARQDILYDKYKASLKNYA